MTSIAQDYNLDAEEKRRRYWPHELQTRVHAVELYRMTRGNKKLNSVNFVCRKYHCSKASLMRWNKSYDGTPESLQDGSHRPKHTHPSAHTDEERRWINNLMHRNPHLSPLALWRKLKVNYDYDRSPMSLRRELRRLGYIEDGTLRGTSKNKHDKVYHTPKKLGIKWQIDVKDVPAACIGENLPPYTRFYQYTCIEEASRQRYLYYYDDVGPAVTVDFIKRCFLYYGYLPNEIQTDNGPEFAHTIETDKVHPVDKLLKYLHIRHHTIMPRTPQHNGKIERSHREDNRTLYSFNKFNSLEELRRKGKRRMDEYNNTPMRPLDYKTPLEKRAELESISKLRRVKQIKKKEAKKK